MTTTQQKTTRQKVTFAGDGATLPGNLFLPGTGTPAPGVVVAGTWTSVKELMADRYAERLADRGYARRFHAGLAGPRDILWTQGAQFDFYDQDPQVTLAADTVAAHFGRTLR